MSISAVIFDLGGVVFDSPLELIRAYERRAGLPEHFIARVAGNYAAENGLWHQLERGEVPLSAFCERFDADARSLGQELSSKEMMRDMSEHANVRPVMIEAIRKLRASGYQVAALTNNWVTGGDHEVRLSPLRAEFDVFVESCKVGMRKPDPKIYELTCEKLGIRPERVAFLDDMGPNLKAGRALGMTTIKVEEPGLAVGELGRILGISLLAA